MLRDCAVRLKVNVKDLTMTFGIFYLNVNFIVLHCDFTKTKILQCKSGLRFFYIHYCCFFGHFDDSKPCRFWAPNMQSRFVPLTSTRMSRLWTSCKWNGIRCCSCCLPICRVSKNVSLRTTNVCWSGKKCQIRTILSFFSARLLQSNFSVHSLVEMHHMLCSSSKISLINVL